MKNKKIDTYMEKHLQKDKSHKTYSIAYSKAQKIINGIFNDEDISIHEVKTIVLDSLKTILDENVTVKSLAEILSHDYYTHTHSIHVSVYAMFYGKFVSMEKSELLNLGISGILHDIGKKNVDNSIINKPAKLTEEEFLEILNHPNDGYKIATEFGIKERKILDGILYHHEKCDGTGYPKRLHDKDIPYFAKIIAVCDVFDALTTKRSYKVPFTTFDALSIMKDDMGWHLDKEILGNFIKMMGE